MAIGIELMARDGDLVTAGRTQHLALRSSGLWQDNGQQEFAICSCL